MFAPLFLSLCVAVVPGQEPEAAEPDTEAWRLTHYGAEAGLLGSWTWDAVFEPDSSAWIAATGGLVHFDGYTWEWLREADGLPSDFVRALCRHPDGGLWVGTDRGVVRVVDGEVVPADLPGELAGPSVRHVLRDRRGRTWFSCDRWPDPTLDAGLSCLEDGALRTYRTADGLPDDHVLSTYETEDGELYAMTLHGLARLEGDRFVQPLVAAGVPHAESRCWSMAEQGDRLIVVCDHGWFLGEPPSGAGEGGEGDDGAVGGPREDAPEDRARRWRLHVLSDGHTSPDLAKDSAGELFGILDGGAFRFVRIDETSRWHVGPGGSPGLDTVTGVRCAPDDSLWVLGAGGVLRWERGPTPWERVAPGRLVPGVDAEGRAWIEQSHGMVRLLPEGLASIPGTTTFWWVGPGGERVVELEDARLAWWEPDGTPAGRLVPLPDPPPALGRIEHLRIHAPGRLWAWSDRDGGTRFAHLDGGRWSEVFEPPIASGADLRQSHACSEAGLMVITKVSSEAGVGLGLLELDGTWIDWELPPAMRGGGLLGLVEDDRHGVWLHGFGGVYRSSCGREPWTRHEGPHSASVSQLVDLGDGVLLSTVSGATGGPGYCFRIDASGEEVLTRGTNQRFLTRLRSGEVCLSVPGAIRCVHPDREDERLIGLPGGLRVQRAVECGPDLLVELENEVLRFRPAGDAPRLLVAPSLSELPANQPWSLAVQPRARFLRGDPHDTFLVRLTVDGQPGDWRELTTATVDVPALPPGEHDLVLEVRDAKGVGCPHPIERRFRVLDPPLQQRLWFRVLVGLVGLSLMATTWAALRSRRRISRALDVQQGEYRALFENAQVSHLVVDEAGVVLHANASAQRLLGPAEGRRVEDLLGHPWPRLLDGSERGEQLLQLDLSGSRHELSLSVSPRGAGLPGHQLALLDVSERRRMERALIERGSQLELAVAGSGGGLWSTHWVGDVEGLPDEIELAPSILRQMGYGPGEVHPTADWWVDQVHPEDRSMMKSAALRILRGESDSYAIEYRVHARHGGWRWLSSWGVARRTDSSGSTLIGVHWDVTERRREEEQRELLVAELNHRVKNTLATVLAIVGQTAQRSDDVASFEDAFRGRIAALARVHETLARRGWEGAPLSELVDRCLAPFRGGAGQRRSLRGPDITIGVQAASTLAMTLHELATNASKYGSLSVPSGELDVSWSLETRDGVPWVTLDWRESGGPLVREPERRSFGTTLVERGCSYELGGEVRLRFHPEGVRCTLAFPLDRTPLEPVGEPRFHLPRPQDILPRGAQGRG